MHTHKTKCTYKVFSFISCSEAQVTAGLQKIKKHIVVLPLYHSPEEDSVTSGKTGITWTKQSFSRQRRMKCVSEVQSHPFCPLHCVSDVGEDERGSLLTQQRACQVGGVRPLIKQVMSFSFQVSTYEFSVVMLIRWCATAGAVVCGSCWDFSDSFFPFLISLVSSPSLTLSLIVTVCFPLCSQSSPEAVETKFNAYTPPNCREQISDTEIYKTSKI